MSERVVAPVERFHHDEAAPACRVRDRLGLALVRRERLLAEDVLLRGDRAERPLGVEGVRKRVVDRVDVRIGEQRLVALGDLGDAVLARILGGPRGVARCDRDDLDVVHLARRLEERERRDPRRAEHADSDLPTRHVAPPASSGAERDTDRVRNQ